VPDEPEPGQEHAEQLDEQPHPSEEQLRSLVENISDVLYSVDVQGILTYVSPDIKRLLDYTPAEVVGRHLSEFIHPGDWPRMTQSLQHSLSGQSMSNEYRLLTRSGESRWVRTSSQPIQSAGRTAGVRGMLVDVTDRKLAEQQLQQQNEFLNSVLESLTHPFYVIDTADYSVQIANSAARQAGVVSGLACYALTHRRGTPCDSAEHPCPLEEIKRTRRPASVEHIHSGVSDG